MSTDDPLDMDRVDQEIRINELKEEARELAGDDMLSWESPDCPPGIAESFWSHVVAYEKAPRSCDLLRLEEMGVALPPPEDVVDAELPGKLREIFQSLARVNTFFIHTDHYSDRELYTHQGRGLSFVRRIPLPKRVRCCCSIRMSLRDRPAAMIRSSWPEKAFNV